MSEPGEAASPNAAARTGRVAVVGRPNVGKSTLVNRLAARRGAIVGAAPGLTRDRLDVEVAWRGQTFTVHDTGGVVEEALGTGDESLTGKVARRAMAAVQGSDVVLFVVDAAAGITADELALAKHLRRLDVPVVVVANKVDDALAEPAATELWALGLGEPVPVSALHGRGSGDLLDRIVELLPVDPAGEAPPRVPTIAIVGRPNVGKSSIFNRLAGEERALVHAEPGTTRDSVDAIVELEGRTYRFVDTAGIRRHAKTAGVEVYSASRTREAIARSDVAILVVDVAEGVTHQDQRIARAVAEAGVGAVLALNKWDLLAGPEEAAAIQASVAERLGFVSYAPLVRSSGLTGRGIGRLVPLVEQVLEGRNLRLPTAALNELVAEAQRLVPPGRAGGRPVRVLYATQVETAPPTFVLFAGGRLPPSWIKFLERRLREELAFTGNPIRFVVRERSRQPRRARER